MKCVGYTRHKGLCDECVVYDSGDRDRNSGKSDWIS